MTVKRQRLWNREPSTVRPTYPSLRPEYILGDLGAVSGDGEKSKTGEKKFGRRKVKNEEKSPWGQGFNGPVPNGRGNSGFWLVPENLCFFLPNHRAAKPGVVSCLLTRTIHTGQLLAIFVWVVRQGFTRGEKSQSQHKMWRWFFAISARNSPEIRWTFRRYRINIIVF